MSTKKPQNPILGALRCTEPRQVLRPGRIFTNSSHCRVV
jgi:hypothetical protein